MYDFVNGCSHGHKLCLTFCSRVRLKLPGMYYEHEESILFGTKFTQVYHSVIFNSEFQLTCAVELLGSNLIGLYVHGERLTVHITKIFWAVKYLCT